jgi:hypothetical protein
MPWYKQSGAFQRRGDVNRRTRPLFASGGGELPLPKAFKARSSAANCRNLANVGLDQCTPTTCWPNVCSAMRKVFAFH